jgi:hypothetical protein
MLRRSKHEMTAVAGRRANASHRTNEREIAQPSDVCTIPFLAYLLGMGTHQVAWTYNTLAFARSIPSPSNDSILASLGVRGRRRDGRLFLPGRMKGCISFFHVGAARTIDDESLHLSWGAASARPTPPGPTLTTVRIRWRCWGEFKHLTLKG